MFRVNPINGSVQWLSIPAPPRTNGPPWTDNILTPSPTWGTGGTDTNLNWGIQPGGTYGSVAVLWSDPVYAMPYYVHRSPENMRSAARRVCDDILRENRTTRMKILSNSCSIFCNHLVNWRDCDWDNLWDEPVDQ